MADDTDRKATAKKKLYRKKTYEEVRKRLAQAGGGVGQEEREYDEGDVSRRAIDTTVTAVSEVSKKLAKMIAENPVGMLVGALLLFILLMILTTSQMAEVILGGMTSGVSAGTYIAEDADIRGAEADYVARERALQEQINNTERFFPGYDEYRYDVDPVGHDKWHLISALTVLHEDFTRAGVRDTLNDFFERQYYYRAERTEETRYRDEERTGYRYVEEFDDDGILVDAYFEEYTFIVRVPYQYTILTVTMENRGFDAVVESLGLSDDARELYDWLNEIKGGKEYLF